MTRYLITDNWTTLDSRRRWSIIEAGRAQAVDHYRSRSSAEHHAAMLNAGRAVVDPHALIGCRVGVTR